MQICKYANTTQTRRLYGPSVVYAEFQNSTLYFFQSLRRTVKWGMTDDS